MIDNSAGDVDVDVDVDDVDDDAPVKLDPLATWHLAVGARSEMQLLEFEWLDETAMYPANAFPKPSRIRWASTKTGVVYLSQLIDRWLRTRAVDPPADFTADVWQGYSYMTPAEVLQAIINRVRDYGHAL